MLKIISKLTLLLSVAFLVYSCSSSPEDETPTPQQGKITIHLSSDAIYEGGEEIAVKILDSKGNEIKSGTISEQSDVTDCANATTTSSILVYELEEGNYTIQAAEQNDYYRFGGKNGMDFTVAGNDCKIIPLGADNNSNSPSQEFLKGKVSFFADNTVGFSKQQITISITDKNDDDVDTGYLRQYTENPNCGVDDVETQNSVYTVYLEEGTYNVYAVEADNGDTQGAWFTGLEGYEMKVTTETCQRFKLGDDPFEEREQTNARKQSFHMLSITPLQ